MNSSCAKCYVMKNYKQRFVTYSPIRYTRYLLAACFVLSGSLKLFSLRAFEQEVQLYGDAYIGQWVSDFSFGIALLVCVVEILAGLTAMFRALPRFAAFAFVAMLSLFVYLTGMNLFFPTIMGSIESCGCFGELIHFTPLISFIKSVILFLIAVMNLCVVCREINIKEGEE